MNDNIVFFKKDDYHESSINKINNLIIKLNDAIDEDSNDEILETLKLFISLIEKYPIPLNCVVISYNFIPNLMNLYCYSDNEIPSQVATLLLKISFHPNLEFIKYFIENNYFDQLLAFLPLISNQLLYITLKIIKNIISDFPQAVIKIYSDQSSINYFCQTISNLSNSTKIIEEIIVILSIISDAKIDFEQKQPILNMSIQFLEDLKYEQYWPLILDIPTSMITSSDTSQYIFEKTKILKICQDFIRSDNESLQEYAIRCVGNHFIYSNKYICVDFMKIIKCAESNNEELSYISLCLLSNALACDSNMISMIEDSGDIYTLLSSYFEQDRRLKCKLEACRAMYSIIYKGNKSQIKKAIDSNFIFTFIQVIEIQDVSFSSSDGKNLIEEIIQAINFLMNVKVIQMKDQDLKILCKKQFNESDGVKVIDELIQCSIPNVARAAQVFKNKYNEAYLSK